MDGSCTRWLRRTKRRPSWPSDCGDSPMARSAQDVLEFGKMQELLRLRTTCAPGRRAVEKLSFRRDAAQLNAEFALIREPREWLRQGRELGFRGLAAPAVPRGCAAVSAARRARRFAGRLPRVARGHPALRAS